MSFDSENSTAQNPNEDQRDVAREATPSQDEEGPPNGSAACAPDGLTPEAVEDAQNVDNGNGGGFAPATRREKLKAWEEKAWRGEMTLEDIEEMCELVVGGSSKEAEAPGGKLKVSGLRSSASRLNGGKSRGPVTEEGKRRASQNLLQYRATRLQGVAEARALQQDPGAAERLYREMIEPFQPAPALVARLFQDLAREYLEMEAWEGVRDAMLEHRHQQATIMARRRQREACRDLAVTNRRLWHEGVHRVPDSPAKLEKQGQLLTILKDELMRGEFSHIDTPLRFLYGKEMEPESERAQRICMECRLLLNARSDEPFDEKRIAKLVKLVEQEIQDSLEGWALELDERTPTRASSLATLATTREDYWMAQHGEQLRKAIDRKLKVLTGLLETLGLPGENEPKNGSNPKSKKPQPEGGAARPQSTWGRSRGKSRPRKAARRSAPAAAHGKSSKFFQRKRRSP